MTKNEFEHTLGIGLTIHGLKGGVQYICLTMTTNFAYLDAKE